MAPNLIGVYFLIFVIAGMIAYAGTEETLKVFYYLGLLLRYQWVMFRMSLMRFKLKRQLDKMEKTYKSELEKINEERKQEFF
jgi:hypothetical protein